MARGFEVEPGAPAGLTGADREEIRQLGEQRWPRALEARDLDALCELCTDDIVYMPADHPALRGRHAFRAWVAGFPRVVRMEQPMQSIDGAGHLAIAEATFAVTLEVEGRLVDSSGKAVCSLRRDSGGSWRVKSVCWNFDQPMGSPAAR